MMTQKELEDWNPEIAAKQAARRYCIVRNVSTLDGHKSVWTDKLEPGECNLTWEQASKREKELQATQAGKSSWTCDVFWILLEGSTRHKDLMAELVAPAAKESPASVPADNAIAAAPENS